MKSLFCPAIAAALLLVGCGEKSNTPPAATNSPASGGSLVTAPVDYLKAAVKAEQNAVKTVDVSSLTQAIRLFNVDQGRYPKDLNELVQERYIPELPPVPYGTKLSYDPNSGDVSVVNIKK